MTSLSNAHPEAMLWRRAGLGVEQAGLVRGDDELNPVSSAEFGQQPGNVGLGGARGDVQGGGDLGVGHAQPEATRLITAGDEQPARSAPPGSEDLHRVIPCVAGMIAGVCAAASIVAALGSYRIRAAAHPG